MTLIPDRERNLFHYKTFMEELHEKMKRKKNRKKPPAKLPEEILEQKIKDEEENDHIDAVKKFREGRLLHWQLDNIDQRIAEEQA